MINIKELQEKLGYFFNDVSLLKQALTHRSYSKVNNERLEFVGDGILDYVIALALFNNYPDVAEGDLSKIRAALVNQEALVDIAKDLDLGIYLFLGDGEEKSGGRQRASILADTLEAIFAAISFDAEFREVKKIIEKFYKNKLIDAQKLILMDSKSFLQEYLQANKIGVPIYNVVSSTGPDHDSIFSVECKILELKINVTATGKTKKEASQLAAELALIKIKGVKKSKIT